MSDKIYLAASFRRPAVWFLIVAVCVGHHAASTEAAIIAQYSFTASNSAATTLDANASSTNINAGTNNGTAIGSTASIPTTGTVTNNAGSNASYPLLSMTNLNKEAGVALTADNAYFTFSVSPLSGYQFNLDSIEFDVSQNSVDTNLFKVAYSFDNFATGNLSSNGPLRYNGATQSLPDNVDVFNHYSLTLSDKDAANNLTDSTITFRVYGRSVTNTDRLLIDNITVNGTVTTIPEPSSFALGMLGIGSLGWLALRRRKA